MTGRIKSRSIAHAILIGTSIAMFTFWAYSAYWSTHTMYLVFHDRLHVFVENGRLVACDHSENRDAYNWTSDPTFLPKPVDRKFVSAPGVTYRLVDFGDPEKNWSFEISILWLAALTATPLLFRYLLLIVRRSQYKRADNNRMHRSRTRGFTNLLASLGATR